MDNFENKGIRKYRDIKQMKKLEIKPDKKIYIKNYNMNIRFANLDVDSDHPEKAFSNIRYYKAMKAVPLKQKKALYLLEVSRLSLRDVAKILGIKPLKVLWSKQLAIKNFKKNLKGEN